jgi:hypothetical protein
MMGCKFNFTQHELQCCTFSEFHGYSDEPSGRVATHPEQEWGCTSLLHLDTFSKCPFLFNLGYVIRLDVNLVNMQINCFKAERPKQNIALRQIYFPLYFLK